MTSFPMGFYGFGAPLAILQPPPPRGPRAAARSSDAAGEAPRKASGPSPATQVQGLIYGGFHRGGDPKMIG